MNAIHRAGARDSSRRTVKIPATSEQPGPARQSLASCGLKSALRVAVRLFALCLAFSLVGSRAGLAAEDSTNSLKVLVRGILGKAQFSRGGAAFAPLRTGMELNSGDVVQTATGAAVDLYLGDIPGTMRLTESTTLALDKLSVSDGSS